MARTKRKTNLLAPTPEAMPEVEVKKKYMTAAYARLSLEDGGRPGSDTLEGQKKLLVDFIARHEDMELIGMWCDNGETGTNFSRPQFEAMMEMVKRGEINCIVVKDLSRFGRNYKETGNYIERIFPFLNVRFIAINDDFDTLTAERNDVGYIVPLKNIINESYSKDLSKKIGSSRRCAQERGEFVGNYAPYGYSKDPNNKHKLVINEETASVVKQIFTWRAEGISVYQIKRNLNAASIPSPSAYLHKTGQVKSARCCNAPWSQTYLAVILANPVYLGRLALGRTHQSLYNGIKHRKLPQSEWLMAYNTHEPIIDQQTFDLVQKLTQEKRNSIEGNRGKYDDLGFRENIFKGLVYCSNCERKMTRNRMIYHGKKLCYTFKCISNVEDPQSCPVSHTREDAISEIVLATIQKQVATAAELDNIIRKVNQSPTFQKEVEKRRGRLEYAKRMLKRYRMLYDSLYQNYVAGLMSEDEYFSMQERYRKQASDAQATISALEMEEVEAKKFTSENAFLEVFTRFQSSNELTREILTALVERIYIGENHSIEIIFKYEDDQKALCNYIDGRLTV